MKFPCPGRFALVVCFGIVSLSCRPATSEPHVGEHTRARQAITEQCYVVADVMDLSGADVLYVVDKHNGDTNTNQHLVGMLGVNNIEAIAMNPMTEILYAADGDQLGTIDVNTGVFTRLRDTFGSGSGALGDDIPFDDIDGLAFDSTSDLLYGSVRRQGYMQSDLLIVIDTATGKHVADAFGKGLDYVEIPTIHEGIDDIDDIAVDIDGQMYAIATVSSAAAINAHLVSIRIDRKKARVDVTDIRDTTVTDIEGLAFDIRGQLWGSAGRNTVLYSLDRETGVASEAVTLAMGTDFEALECLSSQPPSSGPDPDLYPDAGPAMSHAGCFAGPEDASIDWMLLVGVLALGLVGRRRRMEG